MDGSGDGATYTHGASLSFTKSDNGDISVIARPYILKQSGRGQISKRKVGAESKREWQRKLQVLRSGIMAYN